MKIIAFYLPQFHAFPENDEWWGKGFTEWTNVKNAVPIFKGHNQPRIPLNNNYYNLLDVETLRWQSDLANKYGIYGFCFYHYWFDGKILMNRPMELLLENTYINQKFCVCWANEDWTKAWAKKEHTILISQTYGGKKEWIEHFEYLLPFFRDNRYIKIGNKPLFIIYRPELIQPLRDMITLWDKLAKQNGLGGIALAYQQISYNHMEDETGDLFDFGIEYQPGFVRKQQQKTFSIIRRKILHETVSRLKLPQKKWSTIYYDYDDTWQRILNIIPRDEKMIPGAFVDWDNTPRYKSHSSVVVGYSQEKFQRYLSLQIQHAKEIYHKDMIFLFAWNEWGEGGYLEPDMKEGFGRLEAVYMALKNSGELLDEPYEE